MSDFGEGLGTAIEGGLLGRTLDRPEPDAAGHAHTGPVTCANCKTVFSGNFCPECGQNGFLGRLYWLRLRSSGLRRKHG